MPAKAASNVCFETRPAFAAGQKILGEPGAELFVDPGG